MLFHGRSFIFINFEQAAGFGHVAWGFLHEDGQTYRYGSADHLYRHVWWDLPAWVRYMSVAPGSDIDWWSKTGSKEDMLQEMHSGKHHIRYHAYKCINTEAARPDMAQKLAELHERNGWDVLRHNCVHQAHSIISAYGLENSIPCPRTDPTNLIPKVWFSRLTADSNFLG